MRCRVALQSLEYTATFDRPVFALVQRQTELAETLFKTTAAHFPFNLSDLQATGGTTYADVVVAIRFQRLRGVVEVRVDRLSGRFDGLTSQEDMNGAMLAIARCQEAVSQVFPGLVRGHALVNLMSWLTCDGEKQAVEELLATRQQVQFNPGAVGADKARFVVRGQLTNDEGAWGIGFGLEPSVPPEYDLYSVCIGTYGHASVYCAVEGQVTHLAEAVGAILAEFGFQRVA